MLARLVARSSVTLRIDGLRRIATGDLDLARLHGFRDFADEFDRQQSVLEAGTRHLDVVGKSETPFKGAGGDAAMDVVRTVIITLRAAHDELVLLRGDVDLVPGEARYSQTDPEAVLVTLTRSNGG